eukprot:CAMPEP_0179207522 /NCGR_PEP_ID=MMETSP0796-20121207/103485_1 /TAXON_ID=73915 /ORGANISM="Pyrodinium bahamense, Strain pbaha01" /LENGTH=132 /DNA_ID=CAMNT_0020912459 /DNA_START=264 /DNA_END=660 /DNA_ORIENTATION=-
MHTARRDLIRDFVFELGRSMYGALLEEACCQREAARFGLGGATPEVGSGILVGCAPVVVGLRVRRGRVCGGVHFCLHGSGGFPAVDSFAATLDGGWVQGAGLCEFALVAVYFPQGLEAHAVEERRLTYAEAE